MITWVLRAVVAASSVASGVFHYVLWANEGYRQAPVGDMFVAQAVVAVVVGLVALVPRRWAVVPTIVVSVASLVAFALSRGPGVPTPDGKFTETGLNPDSARTLAILFVQAVVVLVGGAVVKLRTSSD